MTLPANDAFTLGLPHDPARIGLRSSSKIPFVSSPATPRRREPQPRQMPALDASPPNGHNALRSRKKPRPNNARTMSPNNARQPRPPVDWEIPRKTLHSSIGFLTLYLYATDGDPRSVVYALSVALVVVVSADIIRLNSPRFEWLFERCLGFLMRESERKSTNGVIWYIIGVIFVLSVYPLDVATVSILILSWADTAASTIGRLWGPYTPPLPRYLPLLRLPLAPRKSLAGFLAGSFTGAAIALTFWGFFYPVRDTQLHFRLPSQHTLALVAQHLPQATVPLFESAAHRLVHSLATAVGHLPIGRYLGLSTLAIVTGAISGTAEALDLGSLDDNLTLPIISGGCIWAFFKVLEYFTA